MHVTRMATALAAVITVSLCLSANPADAAVVAPAKAARAATAVEASEGSAGTAASNITFNPSCTGNTTWVVILEYKLPNRGLYHWCFGYAGTWTFPSHAPYDYASSFCAGNNSGTIKVVWQGVTRTYSFGPGTRIPWPTTTDYARLISLRITGWSGTNRCPT